MDGQEDREGRSGRRVRRSSRRLRKGLLYLVICALVTAILVYAPIFTLQKIELSGANYLTQDDIMSIAQIQKGEPLLRIQTDELQRTLVKDLRIESAAVRRRLPDALEVDLVERRPVASVACDYGYLDFDRTGLVLSGFQSLKGVQIPLVTGVTVHDLYIGDTTKDPHTLKVLDFLGRLDDDTLNQISEINIQDPKAVMAYTVGSIQIRLGDLEKPDEKAELTNDFIDGLKTNKHKIEYVDFSFDAPFIRLKDMPVEKEQEENSEGGLA